MPEPIQNRIEVVEKDWGNETIYANNEEYKYCGKMLSINKNWKISIHFHKEKTETFFLAKGKAVLLVPKEDDDVKCHMYAMLPGASITIPAGTKHSLVALEDSIVLEASTFDKPNDSYRITKSGKASEEALVLCRRLFKEE